MPGDTDLAEVPQSVLIQLAHHLNDTPRKCLVYKTPRCSWPICKQGADPPPSNMGMMHLE